MNAANFKFIETLIVEDTIAVIRLNRPKVLNALNYGMCEELVDYFGIINSSSEIRVVIITGNGKAFCSGADLTERRSISNTQQWLNQHAMFKETEQMIKNISQPLIAAINGPAIGGGCDLALCANLVYADKNAWFAQPEVRLGIIPGMGGGRGLLRRIGEIRAAEMLLTGRKVFATEAYNWGLVNAVCDSPDCYEMALHTARIISRSPQSSVKAVKQILADKEFDEQKSEYALYKELIKTGSGMAGVEEYWNNRNPTK